MLVELEEPSPQALPALLTPFPAPPCPPKPGQGGSGSQQVTRPILGIAALTLSLGSCPALSSSSHSGGRTEPWL